MSELPAIYVKSHVSRDILQNAALFKTDKLVVWEYVANGLQYGDIGTNPTVTVRLDSKNHKITIADNGRGMDWSGLQNFFVMHGENLDRKGGHVGRGRFGTGKSAAFGLANVLRVTSVREGKRSTVQLTRTDLDLVTSGAPVPVCTIEKEVSTNMLNGTLIEIGEVHLRSLDQAGIIRYIERHLAKWPKNSSVFVNNHECEYMEPPIAEVSRFNPTGTILERIGKVELVIKIAKAPVEEDARGIAIFSNGVWHETTLAGSENKEMANFLLGEIDVPALEEDRSPISAFDLSRSMKLNPNNETVQAVYSFIGQHIEAIRKELVQRERTKRLSEESRRLCAQANEIAAFLNEDFAKANSKLSRVRAKAAGSVDFLPRPIEGDGNDLLWGNDLPAARRPFDNSGGNDGDGGGKSSGSERRLFNGQVLLGGEDLQAKSGATNPKQASARGGFQVQFQSMGADDRRATYAPEDRTIYINLEHPQIEAARGARDVDDPIFKRLVYEVAFTEYAIALSSELARRGEYLDASDPIFEIRETINRLARRAASLYRI